MEKFDRTKVIEENFPEIHRPKIEEVDMLDCKIDVNEKEMPIEFEEVVAEHRRFYYNDHHQIYNRLLQHFLEMLDQGMVTDKDGNTLSKESEIVKQWMATEEVKYTLLDQELFEYLYDQICNLDSEDWTKYYDEPDKRVFYKQEDGYLYGSVLTDCIIDASLTHTLCCYDNLEVLDKLMPEFYDLVWLKKVTDVKGMMYGKQAFPWPLAHRDLVFHVTGVQDYKNKGFISVSKSKEEGEQYMGVGVPSIPEGLARIEVKMGFNFFQYLGPNKTRHIALWNTNPQIDYMPTFLMNYMMTNVLYTNMTNLQKFAKNLTDPETEPEIYKYYERKIPYYKYCEDTILDPDSNKSRPKVTSADCPNHPAHKNHPEHDPSKYY